MQKEINAVAELKASHTAFIAHFEEVTRALVTGILSGGFKSPEEYKNQPQIKTARQAA